jgi:hypothetical protein
MADSMLTHVTLLHVHNAHLAVEYAGTHSHACCCMQQHFTTCNYLHPCPHPASTTFVVAYPPSPKSMQQAFMHAD